MRGFRRFSAVWLVGVVGCTGQPDDDSDGVDSDTTPEIPSDPDVDSYIPSTFPPTDAARIIFFGDSITEGVGGTATTKYTALLQHNDDGAWPDWADNDLAARFPNLTEVVDVSLGGATTASVVASQLDQVDAAVGPTALGPTLIVGTIGGNDLLDVVFSGDVEAGIDAVLGNLEAITSFFLDPARFPDGAYLAITNVYDPTDGVGQVEECFFGFDLSAVIPEFDRLEADTRSLAERDGWSLVDMRGHFLGHGFRYDEDGDWADPADPTLWFEPDCIHPNERGHHEIRRLFLASLDGTPLPLVDPPSSP